MGHARRKGPLTILGMEFMEGRVMVNDLVGMSIIEVDGLGSGDAFLMRSS